MKEPLLSSFPPGFNLDDVPVFMQEQFLNQIKAQVLISLKSLINANKENGRINDLIVNKYFSAEERTQSLASVDKYSKSYTEEVEGFYHRINGGNFQNIMFN